MRRLLPALLLLLTAVGASAQADDVAVTDLVWRDAARSRDIAVRIYAPAGNGPFPVIVFSHGLGGSQKGYAYLGRYWAGHGYVSVHVDHPGSDTAALISFDPARKAREAASDRANFVNRPADVSFALDQLEKADREPGPWRGRLDLGRIGVAGHSFGAYTTMAVAGETFLGGTVHFADSRVKAAVAMSTPGPLGNETYRGDYSGVRIPVFHFTGTEDKIVATDSAAARREPFDRSPGPAYLVVFQGGDHMVFSGRGVLSARPNDPAFQREVCRASTAFWDATLKGDAAAKAWLDNGAFAAELGALGTFEKK